MKIDELYKEYAGLVYKYIMSISGIYKGTVYNEHGCFMQHFDIGMNNGDEKFRVSFNVAVNNLSHAVMPAEEVVFSDNAPEKFKSLFSELFGE